MTTVNGTVQSGSTSSARVVLFEATTGTPKILGETTTGANGAFSIQTTSTTTQSIFYVVAEVRAKVSLMAIIGPAFPASITINELTTVAAVYSAAQFFEAGAIVGDDLPLEIVAGMNANVVAVTTGVLSTVLTSPPNADQTIGQRSASALANILASSVRGPDTSCEVLFALTTPPGSTTPPADTLAAMHNIARYPAHNVQQLYEKSLVQQVYQPALLRPPDAWTLAVKVNNSGSDEHMFGGPGNLAFDAKGRAWIVNNVVQGAGNSTAWSILLEADGRPAPESPFTGGGLCGPGFGVAIDSRDQIWIGNFGWGGEQYYPEYSVSLFNMDAQPISPTGFNDKVDRVQGTVVDRFDNVWLASYGNHSVVVYPGGDHTKAVAYPATPPDTSTFSPFGIAMGIDDTAWVTNTDPVASTLCQFRFTPPGTLERLQEIKVGRALKGVAVDKTTGTIWAASGGNTIIYAFKPDGTKIGEFQGGGLDGPWGICLDGNDHVWAANFGPLLAIDEKRNNFHGRLTHLAGANEHTRPFGVPLGAPLSPETGYTLPTAGSPVTLHDGSPLYGPTGPSGPFGPSGPYAESNPSGPFGPSGPAGRYGLPSFIPMMRATGLQIDRAGNVWSCNNWKPDFYIDHAIGNPGGDGMVIFLGLAKPPVERGATGPTGMGQ